MSKPYGGRWQISGALGKGGQAEVFRVVDNRGEYPGEYALKRVLNPARHARFQREIEAIKTIAHPNVIKLIDHSAFDDLSGEVEKQFLVMPLAAGGDLSKEGRVALYKDSIDGLLQVGKQLAAALRAAHNAGVIHRDVKPANVLFTDVGHQVWLSDFGICLLREHIRLTDPGEIVGPRSFLAPELEDGGQLEVTPAADVYSLGKVLYFMISGGVILPRERLGEQQYKQMLLAGERHRMLYTLLTQMICGLDDRLRTMEEVSQRLEMIEQWEKEAKLLPISPEALSGINRLQLRAEENYRVLLENQSARKQESDRLENAKSAFESSVRAEFEKVAAYINKDGTLNCHVLDDKSADPTRKIPAGQSNFYVPISSISLSLEQVGRPKGTRHILEMLLTVQHSITVTVSVVGQSGSRPMPGESPKPPRDYAMAVIPVYWRHAAQGIPQQSGPLFLTKKSEVEQVKRLFLTPSRRAQRQPPYVGPLGKTSSSLLNGASQIVKFNATEWPNAFSQLRAAVPEAMDSFIELVESEGM